MPKFKAEWVDIDGKVYAEEVFEAIDYTAAMSYALNTLSWPATNSQPARFVTDCVVVRL